MYVAVKGGEKAIAAAHELLARERRGDPAVPEIGVDQIAQQLTLAVDRVMAEGSLYDRDLAALAVKQARGDLIEAIFLVRAYRTTLPRFGYSEPVDTSRMAVIRRVSATFKDLPGGQVLGPTFDYTHRLLDFSLSQGEKAGVRGNDVNESLQPPNPVPLPPGKGTVARGDSDITPRMFDILRAEGLVEGPGGDRDATPGDITREPLDFPASRDLRLQTLARGDEGFLLALGYSTQRGYGRTHPFAGEIRIGEVMVEAFMPELGFAIEIAAITLTECEMVNQFHGSKTEPPTFTRGYGLVFGQLERKAMSMALVDRSLRARELGEETGVPAQDEEFVLAHCDNIQATGFVEHLKLPHYVDFQSELDLVRRMRSAAQEAAE
ncbi:MAG: carbon-phosphorus lyase complex subunit PhnI [Hyphomicrobiales bacterium]|nr:carbon-phosphorus lyase complex subunit PhnI [Hyphomicrobiales bacterium]